MICRPSTHRGWSLSPSLPWEGSRADGTPCSLGLTASVFGKYEQMVVTASLRGKKSTSWIFLNSYSVLKKRLLRYGSKRISSSTILIIKLIQNLQTLCFQQLFWIFSLGDPVLKTPKTIMCSMQKRGNLFASPACYCHLRKKNMPEDDFVPAAFSRVHLEKVCSLLISVQNRKFESKTFGQNALKLGV